MEEVLIDSIRVSLVNYQRVVILKQKSTGRYLPIWIGPAEADAIAVRLQEVTAPRPLTHDLLRNVIAELGARVEYVVVSGLNHDTFFAQIVLSVGGRTVSIDSRPSDALALAVRAEVPIYVEEEVMEKAGVALDEEGAATVGSEESRARLQATAPLDEEELRKLSAFKEFVDSLDIDDLGEGKRQK
ncbi:MAG: bifunctional nuclease family protein [Gemmatimonadetes bacterium]|nr:bifunctional nuclease family protein [Gemmatimonadota bacterium]